MQTAIILDCEFLTREGAQRRFWCGPFDPDPVVVQIGAVKLGLEAEFPVLETLNRVVVPMNRAGDPYDGDPYDIDPFFTELTGLRAERVAAEGVPLTAALAELARFADGAPIWSWGKDELNLIAVSCYVAGLVPPIPAERFGNVCGLMVKAGMPLADIQRTQSNALAWYFELPTGTRRAHDALDDAACVADAVQHLLRAGRLTAGDLRPLGP